MDAMFMSFRNSRSFDPYRLLLNLSNKIDIKRSDKSIALSDLSVYYTWKNTKNYYKTNKFKISAPIWNEEFELPDGLYSGLDIQEYFEYIIKKHDRNRK